METKYKEFDDSVTVSDFEEFSEEQEDITSVKYPDSYLQDHDGENGYGQNGTRTKSKSDDTPDEQLRLLYVYFKDMSIEPLFTAQEEVEISAKIKKCEAKSRELVQIVEKLTVGKV